jgi:hypothetical protein
MFSSRGGGSREEMATLRARFDGRPRLPLTDRGGFQLVDQVRYFLRAQGETGPVPILGGFVVEPCLDGRVFVYWRIPGLSVLETVRRRASLLRYERLLRSWATETELHLDAPDPYVACWIGPRLKRATLACPPRRG